MSDQFKCYKCQASLSNLIEGASSPITISRSEYCNSCSSDVKCCKNCLFYDENSYNGCTENQAETVPDKEKSNFCDWFKPNLRSSESKIKEKDNVLKELDSLFK